MFNDSALSFEEDNEFQNMQQCYCSDLSLDLGNVESPDLDFYDDSFPLEQEINRNNTFCFDNLDTDKSTISNTSIHNSQQTPQRINCRKNMKVHLMHNSKLTRDSSLIVPEQSCLTKQPQQSPSSHTTKHRWKLDPARPKVSPEAKEAMIRWIASHFMNPFPNENEKAHFMALGATRKQVNTFFMNQRQRIFKVHKTNLVRIVFENKVLVINVPSFPEIKK